MVQLVAVGVSTSSPSISHVLWKSKFHAFASERKLQEQSLFAEMEQEHEQVSTVNGKVGFCCGDGAGFAGPTEQMDVRCSSYIFIPALRHVHCVCETKISYR